MAFNSYGLDLPAANNSASSTMDNYCIDPALLMNNQGDNQVGSEYRNFSDQDFLNQDNDQNDFSYQDHLNQDLDPIALNHQDIPNQDNDQVGSKHRGIKVIDCHLNDQVIFNHQYFPNQDGPQIDAADLNVQQPVAHPVHAYVSHLL